MTPVRDEKQQQFWTRVAAILDLDFFSAVVTVLRESSISYELTDASLKISEHYSTCVQSRILSSFDFFVGDGKNRCSKTSFIAKHCETLFLIMSYINKMFSIFRFLLHLRPRICLAQICPP